MNRTRLGSGSTALTRLPDTDEEARNRASDGNANLAAARFAEKAAGENVRVAKAGHGPSVALNAGALYYLGLRVRRATDSFMLACLCQASGLAFALVSVMGAGHLLFWLVTTVLR